MKAPAKLHRALQDMGFGYGIGAYFRMADSVPIGVSWQIDKDEPGLLMRPGTCWWWQGDTALSLSPQEFAVLRRDGRLDGMPFLDDPWAFWDPGDVDGMIESVRTHGALCLQAMCDPELMVRVYDYLMGGPTQPPDAFPLLREPWVERHTSPLRTWACAAYLLLDGRFDEAESMIGRLPKQSVTPFEQSLLNAALSRKVGVPKESLEFLMKIGAKVSWTPRPR